MYRCEDCMKKFFESLIEHAMKIINFKKKKAIPLTNKLKERWKIKTQKYATFAKIVCKKIAKEIPVVFHNGWNYEYNFIIKELAKECEI